MSPRSSSRILLSIAALAAASACAVEDPAASDDPAALLARVELPGGTVAEFWEVEPGVIVVGESGAYPQPPMLGRAAARAADTRELYALLTSDEAPRALLEAADREDQRRAAALAMAAMKVDQREPEDGQELQPPHSPSTPPGAAEPVTVDTSKCPWSWFDDQFSLITVGNADDDSWSYEQRTGTTDYLNGRMSIVLAAACSYRGTVTFDFWSKPTNQILWANAPSFTRNVAAGNWYWTLSRAEFWSQYARDIYSEVRNASGDGYHHKGVGCDRKAFTQCAAVAPDGFPYWGE